MNCVLHKSFKLQYFCQTCLDPICQQCVRSNPHSDDFHKIQSISTAVQNRKKRFQLYITNEINPLRQRIRQKLQQLKQTQINQLNYRNSILKDIVLQFEGIEDRTKLKAQKKISQFQTQIKYYQAYLNCIDDLAYTFEKTAQDPFNFLILYKDMNIQLKSLELKDVEEKIKHFEIRDNSMEQKQRKEIDHLLEIQRNSLKEIEQQGIQRQPTYAKDILDEYQLPRQIKTTYSILSTLPQLRHRNQFLNGLIAQASDFYKQQEKKQVKGKLEKQKNSLHFYNNTNMNILALHGCKSCAFCEVPYNLENLNDGCQQNKSIKVQISKNYSHVKIQSDFKGTRRHYWVDSNGSNRKIPDLNAHVLVRANMKKQFINSLKDLSVVKCFFTKYQIQNQKKFIQPFLQADKQKRGGLSKISFKYILTKVFAIKDAHCDLLTELLSIKWKCQKPKIEEGQQKDPKNMIPEKLQTLDYVNYGLLEQFIVNPLFPYQVFEKIQQQIQKNKPIAPKSVQIRRYKF